MTEYASASATSPPQPPFDDNYRSDESTGGAFGGGGSSVNNNSNISYEQQQQPVPTKQMSSVNNQSGGGSGMIMAPRSADEETEDGKIRNRVAVTKIRDAWIYKQIQAKQNEFTQYKQGRLFMGTWNVNAKGRDEPLDDWICADWGPNGETSPDIIAVGFQEIVDLNAVNVAVDNK